jgi:hypothetical protein
LSHAVQTTRTEMLERKKRNLRVQYIKHEIILVAYGFAHAVCMQHMIQCCVIIVHDGSRRSAVELNSSASCSASG